MSSMLIRSDTVIGPNRVINYTTSREYAGNYFAALAWLDDGINRAPSFTNKGNISVTDNPDDYFGIAILVVDTTSLWENSVIRNEGIMAIEARGQYFEAKGAAWGIRANSRHPAFINSGTLSVTAKAQAIAFEGWSYFPAPFGVPRDQTVLPAVTNTGTIIASGETAFGLYLPYGGPIVNSGKISATGARAYAISEPASGQGAIYNGANGVIEAVSADPFSSAISFYSTGSDLNHHLVITNFGSITGNYGIRETDNGADVDSSSRQELVNRGVVSGKIDFGRGSDIVRNQGMITGDLVMGTADDFLDSRGGSILGTVFGGAGDDTLVGGSGNDTLHGEAGNDIFFAGEGINTVNGGEGHDIAVFAMPRATVTIVEKGNGVTEISWAGGNVTTLTGVEEMRFGETIIPTRFLDTGPLLVANFALGAGGWTNQNNYPRHVADLNGDGFQDIVGFGQAGVVVSYGAAGGRFKVAELVLSNFGQTDGWVSDSQFHRDVADVNGDGRADIIGFGVAGTLVSLSRSDGTFSTPVIAATDFGANQGWVSQDRFARTTGDVNGDGKADLIGFGSAGTLISLGNGDGTFQTAYVALANFGFAQGWTSDTVFHRTIADVNGDGRDDIVGFGNDGAIVALSRGDGTFAEGLLALRDFGKDQGWSNEDLSPRHLADVNGDGNADIVGFGSAGVYIAYGKADGFFEAAALDVENFGKNQGWTSDLIYHRELADLDMDGRHDIVGFGYSGVYSSMSDGSDWLI